MEGNSIAINITETPKEREGKAPLLATYPGTSSSSEPVVQVIQPRHKGGYKTGLDGFEIALRLAGVANALGAAIAMGSTKQILPFFTQFFQFKAEYDDFPAFTFFVIANAITASYLALSIPISIVCIMHPQAVKLRVILMFFDTVMIALITSAASAAASIVYLAHNGNSDANQSANNLTTSARKPAGPWWLLFSQWSSSWS